jgi:hypothetical protein
LRAWARELQTTHTILVLPPYYHLLFHLQYMRARSGSPCDYTLRPVSSSNNKEYVGTRVVELHNKSATHKRETLPVTSYLEKTILYWRHTDHPPVWRHREQSVELHGNVRGDAKIAFEAEKLETWPTHGFARLHMPIADLAAGDRSSGKPIKIKRDLLQCHIAMSMYTSPTFALPILSVASCKNLDGHSAPSR